MPNYKGKTPGTRRIVVWRKGKAYERVISGTKADGDAFEARWRVELESQGLSKRVAPPFSSFCANVYKPYAEVNLKDSTWSVRRYQIATLMEFFGDRRLTYIDTELVEQFKRVRRRDVGPTAINNELRILRTVLNYANATNYPAGNPKIVRLKQRGNPRAEVWLTAPELERLFAEARKEPGHLMRLLVFLANTGCRKGEAIACEWSWIDFDAGMIRIPSTKYWQPKNGLPREIPMSDACRVILVGERAHPRWVFPRTRDRKGSEGRYTEFPRDAFEAARARAKLKGGLHRLRHTFAAHFLQAVPDLFLLAQVLGHSHARVTELYAHLLPDHLARARNAVNIGPSLAPVVLKKGRRG
jgi:integrase